MWRAYFGAWQQVRVSGAAYDLGMSITCEPEDAVALLAQVDGLLDRLHAAPLWKLPNADTLTLTCAASAPIPPAARAEPVSG